MHKRSSFSSFLGFQYQPLARASELFLTYAIEGLTILVGATAADMDPWVGQQPSLSLDLNVGLPTARPTVPAKTTKVLVQENFLAVKKDREVLIRSIA